MPQPKKHAVFSFFSGAGFLDLGFEKSGFEIVFANEINKDFVEGYQHSREKMSLPLPRFAIDPIVAQKSDWFVFSDLRLRAA